MDSLPFGLEDAPQSLSIPDEVLHNGPPREWCNGCERPSSACWCFSVVSPPITLANCRRILILQHPKEPKRHVRTALMASKAIANCHIEVTSRPRAINSSWKEMDEHNTFLLFPSNSALTVDEALLKARGKATFILLDGTWDEAKKMLARSPWLRSMRKVAIDTDHLSNFVVRTQPNRKCLSTVETVAELAARIEREPKLAQLIIRPLHVLCQIQLLHGANRHDHHDLKKRRRQQQQ